MRRGRVVLVTVGLVVVIVGAAALVGVLSGGGGPGAGPGVGQGGGADGGSSGQGATPPSPTPAPTRSEPTPESFVVATYNVLGASHTRPGGKAEELAEGSARMRRSMPWLYQHGVSLLGLQELQRSQADTFGRLAGDRWGFSSDPADTENAIAWRTKDWTLVRATTLPVPYFVGERPMPLVTLRSRHTGARVTVLNVHNPANTKRFGDQSDRRFAALREEIRLLRRLDGRGVALLFLGDLNDRDRAFCELTAGGLMHSASGGVAEPCTPPTPPRIDWIFGNDRVRFTDYAVDERPDATGMSDHPIVLARARLRR